MIGFVRRHFGRITPKRRRAELIEDALDRAQKFRVLAMESEVLAARATLDSQHNSELSSHYATLAERMQQAATQEEQQ